MISPRSDGINIAQTKILAFGIGCFFAGLPAPGRGYYEYVNVEWFGFDDSIWFLGFLVVEGSEASSEPLPGPPSGRCSTN